MSNHKSKINLNDIELVDVLYITRVDADILSFNNNKDFLDIDGSLCFKLKNGSDFFCDFNYDNQINNTLLIMNGKPIEYDDIRLENFLILYINKIHSNLYEILIKFNNKNNLDKLYLNVKNIY